MTRELPPQVTGSAELVALRDYLVRMVQGLDQATEKAAATVSSKAVAKAQKDTAKDIIAEAAALKALIIKNANEIISYTDSKVEEYNSMYVAQSDFGNYYQTIETMVEQTARETVETYHYMDAIDALESSVTNLNGQIRKGVITDPDTNEPTLGIAISQSMEFGSAYEDDPAYTWIESGQTFGFYTSTGWQFWINGVKRGWFSSEDSMLHVSNIIIEDALQLGADWEITTTGGFGLRYIGG